MMLDSAVIQKRLDAGAEVHADGRTLQPGGGTPGGSHRHPPTPSPAELLADMPVPGHDDGPGTGDFRLG